MLSYVAKVDPGSVPHFLHKDEKDSFVFRPEREGAHEFESYAQASHVAHEKGGYPVHVSLFDGSDALVLDDGDAGDVLGAAGISAATDEDDSEEPAQAPAGAPTSVHDETLPETKPEEPPKAS